MGNLGKRTTQVKCFHADAITARSPNLHLKQICFGVAAVSIHIICIIGEAQAIRFFVAILLPRKAVLWAAENGVVNGVGNSRFDPEGNVTREQMAVILFRYFGTFKGVEVSARADLSKFPDENRISYKHRTVELLPVLTGEFPPMLPKSPCEYAGIPCGLFVA